MGKAYATLHWAAAVNGDDVEFDPGTSAIASEGTYQEADFQHRAVRLYLLDFGQGETVDLTQDPEIVYRASKGATVIGDNQRFISHYLKSPELFATFQKGYTEAGNIILLAKRSEDKFNMEDFMKQYEEYAEEFLY